MQKQYGDYCEILGHDLSDDVKNEVLQCQAMQRDQLKNELTGQKIRQWSEEVWVVDMIDKEGCHRRYFTKAEASKMEDALLVTVFCWKSSPILGDAESD